MEYTGTITSLVKDNHVTFVSVRKTLDGQDYFATYSVPHKFEDGIINNYLFIVPLSDIGTGSLLATDKAIYYMRWIRKAIENKELIFHNQTLYKHG